MKNPNLSFLDLCDIGMPVFCRLDRNIYAECARYA